MASLKKKKINSEAFIITLTGPSGCGKSTIIDRINEMEEYFIKEEGIIFKPVCIPKYTTRPYRLNELIDLSNGIRVDVESCDKIPIDCDLRYQTYGQTYGLSVAKLSDNLAKGKSPIVIVNDVRVVEEIKKSFSGRVLALFIFREIPKLSFFEKNSEERKNTADNEAIELYNKAIAIYRTYIENIALFDRVIINPTRKKESKDYAQIQVYNLIKGVLLKQVKLVKKIEKKPRLFIISGNAASGKDEIIQAVNEIGKLQGDILPKYTSRILDETDGDEMICQYIPRTDLLDSYKTEYQNEKDEKEKLFTLRENEAKNDLAKLANVQAINMKERSEIKNEYKRFWEAISFDKSKLCNDLRNRLLNEAGTLHSIELLNLFSKTFTELSEIYKTEGYHNKETDPIVYLTEHPLMNEQQLINLISNEANIENDITLEKLLVLKENELWNLYEKEGYHDKNMDVLEYKTNVLNSFMNKYYMRNPKYIIDLEKIKETNKDNITTIVNKQIIGMTGPAYYIEYEDKGWIMYENNQTLYAFDVSSKGTNDVEIPTRYENMKQNKKHCVLVASLIDIFELCKKWFKKSVITVFAYSEISSEEFERKSKASTVDLKMLSFEKEIEKYSNYIVYYDHVTIYAESELESKSGGRTEELIDQIFRLFRYYA